MERPTVAARRYTTASKMTCQSQMPIFRLSKGDVLSVEFIFALAPKYVHYIVNLGTNRNADRIE